MRVLVTGAYGLIGSAVLGRLGRDGHELVAAGRDIHGGPDRAPFARWIEADFGRLSRSEDWKPLLDGIEAVINCVGALQDGSRDSLAGVQAGTSALFAACERAEIRRVVQISAIGAERDGPTAFARTKAASEIDLAARDLDWVILRPGLVLAPAVYGGTAMLRGVAAMPWRTVMVEPEARVQVIGIDELVETVARCLASGAPVKVRWDVAHPQVLRLREIVGAIRRWLGFPAQPIIGLPRPLAAVVARFADALGFLGWRSPARTTAIRQLAMGVVGDPAPWIAATGIAPQSFADILRQQPASVADRWFARMFLLKPLAILGLSLFWTLTGLVTLGPGREAAMAHLAAAGFPPTIAVPTFWLGAWFDVVLGLALLIRPMARLVLHVMLIGTAFYLLIGTVLAPQLWADPLGPFLKIIPMLIATLFTLAILDER
jgi:uncharacterized protein YbjT (DUF2867 family)